VNAFDDAGQCPILASLALLRSPCSVPVLRRLVSGARSWARAQRLGRCGGWCGRRRRSRNGRRRDKTCGGQCCRRGKSGAAMSGGAQMAFCDGQAASRGAVGAKGTAVGRLPWAQAGARSIANEPKAGSPRPSGLLKFLHKPPARCGRQSRTAVRSAIHHRPTQGRTSEATGKRRQRRPTGPENARAPQSRSARSRRAAWHAGPEDSGGRVHRSQTSKPENKNSQRRETGDI